MSKTFRENFH